MDFWSGIGQWFANLWDSIVSFVLTGNIGTNTSGSSLLGRILIAAVVFAALYYLSKFIVALLKRHAGKAKAGSARTSRSFLASIVKALLMIITVVIVLAILGFDMSGMSTIISAAVVAIGLSLQDIIGNFASGIIIITSQNVVVGDFISVNNGEVLGAVKDVSLISTKLVTYDNIIEYVPNSVITSGNVINYSVMKYRMIDQTVSVAYGSDIGDVKKILHHCIACLDGVIKDMPVRVSLKAMSDSSLDFTVRFYVPNAIYWDVLFASNELFYKELSDRNISIPFNQLDVNLYQQKPQEIMKAKTDDIKASDCIRPAKAMRDPAVERGEDKGDIIDAIIAKNRRYSARGKKTGREKAGKD